MAVNKKSAQTVIGNLDNTLVVGAIKKMNSSYSTHFERNFNVDGSPSDIDIEAIFNAPQDNIENIVGYSKYCYRKYGIIMRVINIIRDFSIGGFELSYPKKDNRTKEVIKEYNDRIGIRQLIKDMVFELSTTGNLVCYDRDGDRVDLYPINQIEVLPLVKDNKQLIAYKNPTTAGLNGLKYDKEISDLIENNAYPEEILKGKKAGKEIIMLKPENAYFSKINASQYERYGLPVILPAFEDLAHKSLLKEAEKSTANAIIEKILTISIGDAENRPTQELVDQYNELFDGLTGSVRVALPYYVKLGWVEPASDIFGKEKFVQIDTDILNTLGVSLTLIRGEGTGSYSDGIISFSGLIKTIESITSQIPDILNGLYRAELERNGINPNNAPTVRFKEPVIDKEARLGLVMELFQNAGLPYEVLFEEYGYDFDHIKLIREEENDSDMEKTFELHTQPFQGEQGANSGGAPKKTATSRKSDVNKSNNKNPRPSK